MQKIDVHVHVTPPEIIANIKTILKKEPYFELLASSPKNKFATAEDVIAELDRSGFDKAVIFGFGFKDISLCRIVNNYVIEKVKQYPNRLIGFCVVPVTNRSAKKEIERSSDAGLVGVGELFPTGQCMQIDNENITGSWCEVCGERNMPVLIHTNEPVGHYYPGKTSTTLPEIEKFIRINKRIKNAPAVILAHLGGGFFFYEMMRELQEACTNVYYDCAASPLLYDKRIYQSAFTLGLQHKILFGSDYPLLPISRYLQEIDESGVAADNKTLLLGGNAESVLGIEPLMTFNDE